MQFSQESIPENAEGPRFQFQVGDALEEVHAYGTIPNSKVERLRGLLVPVRRVQLLQNQPTVITNTDAIEAAHRLRGDDVEATWWSGYSAALAKDEALRSEVGLSLEEGVLYRIQAVEAADISIEGLDAFLRVTD